MWIVFGLACVDSIIDQVKYFVLYYFILEMLTVKIKIASQSREQYLINERKLKIFKVIVFGSIMIMGSAMVVINTIRNYYSIIIDKYRFPDFWRATVIVLRAIKVCIDVVLFFIFILLMQYFIR